MGIAETVTGFFFHPDVEHLDYHLDSLSDSHTGDIFEGIETSTWDGGLTATIDPELTIETFVDSAIELAESDPGILLDAASEVAVESAGMDWSLLGLLAGALAALGFFLWSRRKE